MKNKKIKIVLSVFTAVIVIATATFGINYGIYISKANAVGEKIKINNCTDVTYTTVSGEKKLPINLKNRVYDLMINSFQKYEPTQEQIDNRPMYYGYSVLGIGDADFTFFDRIIIDGNNYSIYHLTNGSSSDAYYIIKQSTEVEYTNIFHEL